MAAVKNAFAPFGGINPSQLNFSFSSLGGGIANPNGGRIDSGKFVFFNSNGGESVQGTLFDAGGNYTSFEQVGAAGGSLAVRIYANTWEAYNPNRTGTIAMVHLSGGVGFATYNLIFPNVTIPLGTYRDFYIGSYTSDEFAQHHHYHLFTATTLGSRISEYFNWAQSDSISMTEVSNTQTHTYNYSESCSIVERFKTNPRRYPVERIAMSETMSYIVQRHATVSDWQFNPDYRIMFQGTNDSGTWGTTNWHNNVKSWGRISKSIKHWTGDFEIGEWNPSLADPVNELYGSLYATQSESRYKEVQLMAMIADKPLTYIPQFGGVIDETTWEDGLTTWAIRDKIKDFPYRSFVHDYENLGTIKSDGKQIGIVKRIVGTDVMFDDDGNINYITVKRGGNAKLNIGGLISDAVAGGIAGGWLGAAEGAGLGLVKGLFGLLGGGDETISGYWQLTDFNAVPDGVVKSGAKMKFYGGSISGVATNSLNPLFNVKEYNVLGGTFRNTQFGFNGTCAFDDTRDIHLGDYIYVRKPLLFAGNPAEIIKAILCGSNIDFPYYSGTSAISVGFFGSLSTPTLNDFNSVFDSELNSMALFNLAKFISPEFDTSPFDEIKELVRELQISFYIDESNKFSIRCIKPRNLISAGTEIHYRQNINILDGFKWSRSTQDALVGVRIYYNWLGDNSGAYLNQYNKMLEVKSNNPISGVNQWGTIESKWIRLDEDAKMIAYRTLVSQERGLDRIEVPTTLYGISHTITDIIRVTHNTGSLGTQLFELESYEKDFTTSKVNLSAVNLSRAYGHGNCIWVGTSVAVSNATQSGWSVMGASGVSTQLGTLTGTFLSFGSTLNYASGGNIGASAGVNLASKKWHYIMFGSNINSYTEICAISDLGILSGGRAEDIYLKRGLFNTIPRTYFSGETMYDLGAIYINPQTGSFIPPPFSSFGSYTFGTSANIATNIGTAFKFS